MSCLTFRTARTERPSPFSEIVQLWSDEGHSYNCAIYMEWYAISVNVYKVQWDKWVSNLDNLGMVNIWNSSKPGLITMKLLNQKKRIHYVFYKVNFAMMSMVRTKIIIGTKRTLSPYLVWTYLVKEMCSRWLHLFTVIPIAKQQNPKCVYF